MKDRRLFLKVKIKSLVAESRIIRQEERRQNCPYTRTDLLEHRRGVVRFHSRINNLAYGFIRGRSYRQMERSTHTSPDWNKVWGLVKRFGACFDLASRDGEKWSLYQQRLKDQEENFLKWKLTALEKVAA